MAELQASGLTRAQFDAAELHVRRAIVAHEFDKEELVILRFYVERTFIVGRVAAFIRNFAHLAYVCGRGPGWRSHAHEAFSRLVEKRVLVCYAKSWHGINVFTLEWKVLASRLAANFDEEPELPTEPELQQLLTEAFINSAGQPSKDFCLDRGRGTGPALDSGGNQPEERLSPPVPAAQLETPKITPLHWQRLSKAIERGTVHEEFPDLAGKQSSPGSAAFPSGEQAVPEKGTFPKKEQKTAFCSPGGNKLFPKRERSFSEAPDCSLLGNTENANGGAGIVAERSPAGNKLLTLSTAPIASSALSTKAELSCNGAEPTFNEKVAAAWNWLERIDTSGGLKVKRFHQQWTELCRRFPDYVLKTLPNVVKRQIELRGSVEKPLALCAKVARADGKMR